MTNATRILLILLSVAALGINAGNLFLASQLFGSLIDAGKTIGPAFWKNAIDVLLASCVLLGIGASSRPVLLTALPIVILSQGMNVASFLVAVASGRSTGLAVVGAAACSVAYIVAAALACRTLMRAQR